MTQEQQTPPHVIVCTAYGCTDVYPATKANALRFFNDHKGNLPAEAVKIAQADPAQTRHLSARDVVDAIKDTYRLHPAAHADQLRKVLYGRHTGETASDKRPEVVVEADWGPEIALWIANKGLILDKLSAHDVIRHEALSLKMFAPLHEGPRKVELVQYEDEFAMSDGYRTIVQDRWKDGASELSIARFILNFVHTYLVDKSDVRTLDVFPVTDMQ